MALDTPQSDAALLAGLQNLFAAGAPLINRKLPPPVGVRFSAGNKASRRYTLDDCAIVSALYHLGFTYYGIQQMARAAFPSSRRRIADTTIKRILSGPEYQDIRDNPLYLRRREHYISHFEPAVKAQQAGWQPPAAALQQARHAAEGSVYRGGR